MCRTRAAPDAESDETRLFGRTAWSGKSDARGNGTDLDVANAESDRNKGRDEKLRTLGWEKYGKRLKKHSDAGKLKDSGADHLDPQDDGDEK